LSAKVQPDTNLAEVLINLRNGKDYFVRSKTGIFVTPDNFRNGEIVVNRRKVGNDVQYHEEQLKKMNELCAYIMGKVSDTPKEQINSKWFKEAVDRFNHPEKYDSKVCAKKTFCELAEEYLSKGGFSVSYTKSVRVLVRDVARYEGFKRATEDKAFTFDVDKVTRDDIEDFFDYLRNEKSLSEEYPEIFRRLLESSLNGLGKGHAKLETRGSNTLVALEKKLRAFFLWLYDSDKTSNRPFDGVRIGTEKYGTPYYITIEERNAIADFDFSSFKSLEAQRDIFVFQCLVGCRVSDLVKLTQDNITNGVLVYAPHKTKDEGEQTFQARVPLHSKAVELVDKYRGRDGKGRLFPFITPQKYNEAIKEIFTRVGITRKVVVRNPQTGENETRPLNEIASSHLARRTFVGNAYFKVSDPNIIGKMSGHVEGSKAFARYRKIEDSTLMDVISQLG
jgi:integrase